MSRRENYFQTQLFKPSKVRNVDGTSRARPLSLSETAQDTFGVLSPSSSFRFDPSGNPLKNTQQLNVDYSKFENHCFFNSAKNKVHIAMEKIINQYPFDGTRAEHEKFFNNLTGFEKYVYDEFPKNTGFLIFSGTSATSGGTYLRVHDYEGVGTPGTLEVSTAKPKLNFESGPFTVEFSLFSPEEETETQIITQRLASPQKGFSIFLSASADEADPSATAKVVAVLSDIDDPISASMTIEKGKFNQVAVVYDRGTTNKLNLYLDGVYQGSSKSSQIGNFNFVGTDLLIGSGTNHQHSGIAVTPTQTLSGALDEFRFFNSERTDKEIEKYRKKDLYAQDDLQLYFRFNEPSGSFSKNGIGNDSLVLDHSGNGMHTFVNGFSINQRNSSLLGNVSSPMTLEDPKISPVLFPSFEGIQDLATSLMSSAAQYDVNNPNLITNLVPRHYLEDAAVFEGKSNFEGDIGELPGLKADRPGGNEIKQSQLISSVLFMWAESFDEIKMFIDEMGRLLTVDYKDEKTISDSLIPFLAKYHGFTLPSQFNSATLEQFLEGRSITVEDALSNYSLQKIQNTVWRRILADLPFIRQTKGTRSSFRSILRNMGINPDGPFRIREYGGAKTKRISDSYERRKEVAAMLDFSGSFRNQGTIDGEGKDSNRPLFMSPFLSGTRVESGLPEPKGTISKVGSDEPGDGLFTSGSWTVEGIFKFESNINHPEKQSLMRIQSTGSEGNVTNNWLLFNVVATKEDLRNNQTGSIDLYGSPTSGSSDEIIHMKLNDLNIFDGNKWHISFGRNRSGIRNNYHSSSYFLRAGKQSPGNLYFSQSLNHYVDKQDNPLTVITASNNASGAFIAIGSMSLGYDKSSSIRHLNGVGNFYDAKYVNFTGKASGVRFFSKGLSKKETMMHVRNFKSVGVEDPTTNYSFTPNTSGTFERLRVDLNLDQQVTKSNSSGRLEVFDFSQNLFHGEVTGLAPNTQVIDPEGFDYVIFTPKFEMGSTDNKIRVRSYKSVETAENAGVSVAPLYAVPQDEKPSDDRRFEVEVSVVQALNEDIMNIFATLDFFDNAIGDPELVFSEDYRELRNLRRIYFNRLEDKISIKQFFDFFKWFDVTVGDVFEELVPRTSRYLGTNFVIENHALERPKFKYNYSDMYLGELDRRNASLIFLQQFIGSIKKF